MQIAIRSYLTAGVAAAGAAALVVAPIAPKMDVPVPSVRAAVALAASPLEQALIVAATGPIDVTAGLVGSALTTVVAYPSYGLTVGLGLLQTAQDLLNNPGQIGLFLAGVPALTNQLISGAEVQTFGVATGVSPLAPLGEQPGVIDVPALTGPAAPQFYPNSALLPVFGGSDLTAVPGGVPGNIPNGINSAADKTDNLIKTLGGPPKVLGTITRSTQAIGTSFIQAQGLVRSSMLNAASSVATTAVNGGNVNAAIQAGLTSVQKSILGDPASPVPGSVENLGAIKTVTHTVQKAVKDVGTAIGGGTP